jgi:hypothetical protein
VLYRLVVFLCKADGELFDVCFVEFKAVIIRFLVAFVCLAVGASLFVVPEVASNALYAFLEELTFEGGGDVFKVVFDFVMFLCIFRLQFFPGAADALRDLFLLVFDGFPQVDDL